MEQVRNSKVHVIRLANRGDAPQILDIYQPIVVDTAITFELECPSIVNMEHRIENSFKKHLWIVSEYGDRVTGYAYASEFRKRAAYRWITEVSVYVHVEYRKQGIAKSLYDVLHNILRHQGYTYSMAVMTSPNPASQNFHEKYGFRQEALMKNMGYKFQTWYDIEIMSMQLNDVQSPMEEIKVISEFNQDELNALLN